MMPETEKEFQQAVREFARLTGWRDYCHWTSIRSPAGYPDLTLLRPPRVVFAELKSEKGRVSAAQEETLALLRDCPGVETYLWRPSDWDAIAEALR